MRRQREHKPHELGPRVFFRGRWAGADLRPWGGVRVTLRNPDDPRWPHRGERTDWPDVAERWKWAYVDALRGATRARLLRIQPNAKPLEQAVTEFLAHREATAEPLTVRNNRAFLTSHLLSVGGKTTADITTTSLQRLFNGLTADGYAASTLENYLAIASAFFRWCGGENPARGVELRGGHATDAVAWADEELARIRKTADKLDAKRARDPQWPQSFRLLVELGVATGGRRAELLALDWSAFRGADRSVRFTAQLNERGTGTKGLKGKKNRTALVLPSWWAYRRRSPSRGPVLLPRPNHGATFHAVRDWAAELYGHARVTAHRAGWHTLRHTYARIFLERGGSLEQLQKSLGHESITTTESTYEHFTHEKAAEQARRRIYGG